MQVPGDNTLITINKRIVCYDDQGQGKLPLIFIHGFPFDKSSWKPQMDDLKNKYRVIAYDLRGFGRSQATDEKFSISLFADDLILFMDALEINKAVVCGLSMGGYIALNAINRYPERFEGIILANTQCIADTDETRAKRYKSISQVEAGGLEEFASGFIANAFSPETHEQKKEVTEEIKKVILSTNPATITATLHALAERWEACSILPNISVPALILTGREDKVIPPPQSQYMQSHIKGSEFHFIEKSGHLSNLENPDEFNTHVSRFLSKFSSKRL